MQKQKHSNIPIFIPELACPHRCVFCDQEKISGSVDIPEPGKIYQLIENNLDTMRDGRTIEIAFYGGNFTGIPLAIQTAYLQEAYKYVVDNSVTGIRISTRPDYIDKRILDLLKQYGVTTIELGAQSTDEEVLRKSGRGHSVGDIENSSRMILEHGFKLGLQMMLGLPGDTFEKSLKTARDIVALGANNSRIYPTLVIKGTALEKLFRANAYTPLTLADAVRWTKEIVKVFEENSVKILRMGLHPSKEFDDGKSLVAGPYHPSFGELVRTEIWNDVFSDRFRNSKPGNVTVKINSSQLNFGIGYKARNKIALAEKGIIIKLIADSNLTKYQFDVSYN